MVCSFFGHKDAGEDIKPKIYDVVEVLIVNHQADVFTWEIRMDLIRW